MEMRRSSNNSRCRRKVQADLTALRDTSLNVKGPILSPIQMDDNCAPLCEFSSLLCSHF